MRVDDVVAELLPDLDNHARWLSSGLPVPVTVFSRTHESERDIGLEYVVDADGDQARKCLRLRISFERSSGQLLITCADVCWDHRSERKEGELDIVGRPVTADVVSDIRDKLRVLIGLFKVAAELRGPLPDDAGGLVEVWPTAHYFAQSVIRERIASLGVAAVGPLVRMLDERPNWRFDALSLIRDIREVPDCYRNRVEERLDDPEALIRQRAADAVCSCRLQGPGVFAKLCELLDDSDSGVRASASWAIGQFDGDIDKAVPRLRELLADEDRSVRDYAAAALRYHGIE